MMRSLNGAPVDPDAAGCCAGLIGIGNAYAPCATAPTTSGILTFPDSVEVLWAFACDRHAVVLGAPRELTADDIAEIERRSREGRWPVTNQAL